MIRGSFRRRTNFRGLTLAEVLVSLFLIGIFGLVAVGSLQMALRQWGSVAQKVNAAQNARFITSTIANELRQAIPWADPTRGYMSITPAVAPTGVLTPNANAPNSAQVVFTEPHPTTTGGAWDPMQSGWSSTSASNYRTITYRVQGLDVIRENRPGTAGTSTQEIIASAQQNGQVTLAFLWQSPSMVNITVTAREGQGSQSYTSSYQTACFIVGK